MSNISINIPLQATKRRRCLNFDLDTAAVNYVEDLSAEAEERIAITKLQLWKKVGFDNVPPKYETDDMLQALALDVVSALESSKATRSDRQMATENAFKSVEEFNQLISLTSSINAREHIGVVGCFRERIEKRGIPIPPVQAVQLLTERYEAAERALTTGIDSARPVVTRRRKFTHGLLELKQSWSVGTREQIYNSLVPSGTPSAVIPPIPYDKKNDIVVDCSFVPAGDGIGSLPDYLVPLLIGEDGPTLGETERLRGMKTIQFSALCRTTGKIITRTTAWDTSRAALAAATGPTSEGLKSVHEHLQKRQHEALSQRLFMRLGAGAMRDHDRWTVQPAQLFIQHIGGGLDEQVLMTSEEAAKLSASFVTERLFGSVDVSSVERGEIVLNLSENIALSITLTDIPFDPSDESSRSIQTDSTHSATSSIASSKDAIGVPISVSDGAPVADAVAAEIHKALTLGLLQAQRILLGIFRDRYEESKTEGSSNSGSSVSVNKEETTTTATTAAAAAVAVTLSLKDIVSRLVDPSLKERVNDLGDGLEPSSSSSSSAVLTGTAGAAGGAAAGAGFSQGGGVNISGGVNAVRSNNFFGNSSTASATTATATVAAAAAGGAAAASASSSGVSSSSGAGLLVGMLDVIRCTILSQRLEKLLQRLSPQLQTTATATTATTGTASSVASSASGPSDSSCYSGITMISYERRRKDGERGRERGGGGTDTATASVEELLLSGSAMYDITLPRCDVTVAVTSRFGFEVFSSSRSASSSPNPSFSSIKPRNNLPTFQDMPVVWAKNPYHPNSGSTSGSATVGDMLFHPCSARFDTIAHLESFFGLLVTKN